MKAKMALADVAMRREAHERRAGCDMGHSLAQVDLLLGLGVIRLGGHDGGCVMVGVLKRCMDSREVREMMRSAAAGRRWKCAECRARG